MKAFGWIACVLVVVAAAGCASDDGPAGNGGLEYPDIPGLVAFYDFNGNLNNAVSDLHHGETTGPVVYVADHGGTANSAVQVGNDTILVADDAQLDITGPLTLAAWIRPGLVNWEGATILDKDGMVAYAMGVQGASTADTVRLWVWLNEFEFVSDEVVPMGTGAWSHVLFTCEGDSSEGRFYVNGIAAGSQTQPWFLRVGDHDLMIGKSWYGGYQYNGAIDKVAIFNRSLTSGEVQQIFNFE